ncbi:MAG: chloramphenicol phosphotransferase [Devosia sp.]|nr:chloramphenicol phosphotransferase [Devosia sp.]
MTMNGRIVILNGAPRSGKSSIARVIQSGPDGPWMNLGVDVYVRGITPPQYRPGLGLRPGGERPDLEALVPTFYLALYDSIAAHSRLGLNVVADVGHHDAYQRPLHILPRCARRLQGLPVLFVGVRCSIEKIMERRNQGEPGRENDYVRGSIDEAVPGPVAAWQREVHSPGVYDLEVDTSVLSPEACAAAILARLNVGGLSSDAFRRLARLAPD